MTARRWWVVVVTAVLVQGCGAPGGGAPRDDRADQPTRISESPVVPRMAREDAGLLHDFVAFALDPGAATVRRLPLSPDGVALGLGRDLVRELPRGRAANPLSWLLRSPRHFRGRVGPFSVLRSVAGHVRRGSVSTPVRRSGDLQMSLGEHPHCAGPPVPPPPGLEDHRRVSLQPSAESITTCLAWFTADLFLDHDGSIVAVTLDLWEP